MTYREAKPILEKIKKYFGTNHRGLTSGVGTMFPDMDVDIEIHISKEEILELFVNHFQMEPIEEVCDILWLNANAGYDRYYEKHNRDFEDNYEAIVGSDVVHWQSIEQDLINLYALLRYSGEPPIKVSIGDKTIEMNNTLDWFKKFFKKYCFSKVIPEITSAEQAKEVLNEMTTKSVGHPVDRWLENSIVFGISNIAQDYHLVKSKAPQNLRLFIREYMCLMKIISPDDIYIKDSWIKAQIGQLPKYKSEVVLRSSSTQVIDSGNNPLFWEEDKLCYLIDMDSDSEPTS